MSGEVWALTDLVMYQLRDSVPHLNGLIFVVASKFEWRSRSATRAVCSERKHVSALVGLSFLTPSNQQTNHTFD